MDFGTRFNYSPRLPSSGATSIVAANDSFVAANDSFVAATIFTWKY
jgi:hypothetical protein